MVVFNEVVVKALASHLDARDFIHLKYISRDFMASYETDDVESVADLFRLWQQNSPLRNQEFVCFVAECLDLIDREDLLVLLGVTRAELWERISNDLQTVSDYTKLVINLSLKMQPWIEDRWLKILYKTETFLEGNIMVLLENAGYIAEHNMTVLQILVDALGVPEMSKLVSDYEAARQDSNLNPRTRTSGYRRIFVKDRPAPLPPRGVWEQHQAAEERGAVATPRFKR